MTRFIRWPGLAVFAGIVILLAVIWYVFVDYAVEYAVERTGTKAVGARVDLDFADLSLFPLGLELGGLQVTNPNRPMRNAVQIGRIRMQLNTSQLIMGRKVVEDMAVTGMAFNTERASSGALPGREKSAQRQAELGEKLRSKLGALPSMSVKNAKEILEKEKLATVEEAKALKEDIAAAREEFQNRLENLPDEKTFAEYQKRIDDLGGGDGGLMGVVSKAGEVQEIRKDIQADIKELRATREELTQTRQNFQERLQKLKNAPARDARRLADKYGLSPKGLGNISALFFGPKYAAWVEKGLGWYARLSPYLAGKTAGGPEEEKKKRGEGVDVRFDTGRTVPQYWVKKAEVSMRLAGSEVGGDIRNFSTNQPGLGLPLEFSFSGTGLKQSASLDIKGAVDRTSPSDPEDRAEFVLRQYPVGAMNLIEQENFGLSLQAADLQMADGSIRIAGKNLDADIAAGFGSADFRVQSGQKDNLLLNSLADTMSGISSFKVRADLSGSMQDPEISIASDIDDVLAGSLKNTVAEQQEKLRAKLKSAISERTRGAVSGSESELAGLAGLKKEINERLSKATSVMPE